MTAVFHRRRAEAFALRVEGGADGRDDAELDRLVPVVGALRTHAASTATAVLPRAEVVADLRERLLAEAASVLSADRERLTLPPRTRTRERRLVAVASAVVVLGGSAGMATAAQHALPGDALYPVKRGLEKAEVTMSTSPAGRGRDLLDQAGDRLEEVRGLIDRPAADGAPRVPGTLDDFTRQARQGGDLLLESYRDTRDPASVADVRRFSADALATLDQLSTDAPAAAQPGLREAARALTDLDQQAAQLCTSCSDLPRLSLPTPFLVSAEARRALGQAESVTGSLGNDHPVVADRDAVRAAERAARALGGATAGGSGPSGSSTPSAPSSGDAGPSAPSTSSVPSLPSGPGAPLPSPKAPKVTVKVKVGDQELDLGSGLGGVVETLLPQPDDSPLGGLLP